MDVARSSTKVFLAEVVGVGLSFLAITYFARELGSGGLGTFFLFEALLFIFGRPADLGVRLAAEKRISGKEDPAAILSSAVVLKTGLLAVTLLLLLVTRGYVNDFIGQDLTGLLGVALVLREASTLMKNVLSGELRVGETAIIDFAYNVVKFGGGALLIYANFGVIGLVYSLLAAYVVRFVLAFRATDVKFGRPSRARMRSLLGYAKYTIIPGIAYQVNQWMDVVLLGYFLTNDAVGTYEVAWRIGGPVLLVSRSIGVVLFPQFSSWSSAGSKDDIEGMISSVLTPSLLLVFPAFFGSLVLSPEILGLVFGPEFEVAWIALIIIMAGKIPSAVRVLFGEALNGLDQPRCTTIATGVGMVTNLVLNVVLISQFGVVGAAVGTMTAIAVGTAVRSVFLSRFIRIDVPYDELGWCFAASAAMGILLYGAKIMVPVDSVVTLLVFVVAGAILYFGFVFLYPPLKTQITSQLQRVVPWPL